MLKLFLIFTIISTAAVNIFAREHFPTSLIIPLTTTPRKGIAQKACMTYFGKACDKYCQSSSQQSLTDFYPH